MNKIILEFLILFHIIIWVFVLGGGILNSKYAKFNILILIPFIYIIRILPIHLIVVSKNYIIKNEYGENANSGTIISEKEYKYILPYLFGELKSFFNFSHANPLSADGLLILGYIINVYLMVYKWKEWQN